MFPYPVHSVTLFGQSIGLFTLFTVAAIAVGSFAMDREMERLGFSATDTLKTTFLILFTGLYSSHFVALFFYNYENLAGAGWTAYLDPLNGMSSMGGFLGAAASFLLMRRWIKGRELQVADAAIWSVVLAWGIARLGCTFAFDHPGSLSNFILAFDHPSGGPRHNLGFYEMLYSFLVLLPAAWYLRSKRPPPGSQIALACLLYAPARFFMDFLRSSDIPGSDVRYLGLTFAQYGTIFLLMAGVWVVARIRGSDGLETPSPEVSGGRRGRGRG